MAIEEIDTAYVGLAAGSADIAITHGMTIAAGDVLVAFTHNDTTATQSDNNGATPFTVAHHAIVVTDKSHAYIWVRVAGASEPAAYHWTVGAGVPSRAVVLRQFRGVDTSNIWDVVPSASTDAEGTSNSPEAPSINITSAGSMGLLGIFIDASTIVVSSPTNSYGDLVQATQRIVASCTRASLSAGAVGAAGAHLDASDDWLAIHCALKPLAVFSGLIVTRTLNG
jgi:hypothetical protein